MKLYIAVLDEVPDRMTPTLATHAVLGAHLQFQADDHYNNWLRMSFKKVVVRVNEKEFDEISALDNVYVGHEIAHAGDKWCAVVCPMPNEELPNVLKFAKLWRPKL